MPQCVTNCDAKMYSLITILSLLTSVWCVNLCDSDSCVCRYNRNEGDFIGESVDCTYNPGILEANYTLPNIVHSLDLSSNNLTRIKSSSLLQSTTLTELLLNNNDISEIDPSSFQLSQLKRLDLSDNSLSIIHGDTFQNMRKLEYLNLANNKFANFSKLTFHRLSNLKEVVLDNNNIGPCLADANLFDRDGFGLTNKIQRLSISGINLNLVPDNFFVDAYDLKKLVISNNNLSVIFEIPFTLKSLDLSDNPIKEISGEDFSDLPALEELKLNNLDIKEVPEYVFASLHGLIKLELERNMKLIEFNVLAFGQEVLEDSDDFILESFSLKGSRLTTLDEKLIEPFGQLIRLDLQGNPWKCDCKLGWLKKLQIQPSDYENLKCATPKNLYNSRIFDLNEKNFTCTSKRRLIGITVSVISFCILLASMAMWLFIYLPWYQSRNHALSNMYIPSTAYSVLPTVPNTPQEY